MRVKYFNSILGREIIVSGFASARDASRYATRVGGIGLHRQAGGSSPLGLK